MESYGFEIYINEIRLKEGVKEFIELLKTEYETWNRNKQFKKAGERLFKINGILDAFDYICTSDEVPRSKPEPDVYLHAKKDDRYQTKGCIGL